MTQEINAFEKLRAVNVTEQLVKTEDDISYLPWAIALDLLLSQDPNATFSFADPREFGAGTLMVFATVNAFGKSMTAQLPVLDETNGAISKPDALAVNASMQRALVKAIALHGLGLEVYSKDGLPKVPVDLPAKIGIPETPKGTPKLTPVASVSDDPSVMTAVTARIAAINASNDLPRLAKTKLSLKVDEPGYKSLVEAVDKRIGLLQKQAIEHASSNVSQPQAESAQEALAA